MVDPDTGGDPVGMPRWVKIFGLVTLLLAAVFLAVHLAGGGLGMHGSH